MGTMTGMPAQSSAGEFVRKLGDFGRRVKGRLKPALVTRTLRYGLRRDLTRKIDTVSAKIPISVRPLQADDLAILLPEDTGSYAEADQLDVRWRREFVDKVGIAGCYVAIDDRDGTPCYMQWLLGPLRNDLIARLGGFPQLAEGEALLENAYTPPSHRGLGIMSAAMAMIAERAADVGARHVLTFVGVDNIASLKGCRRAGFDPHLMHTRSHLLFGVFRTDRFDIMSEVDPRRDWNI